MTESTDRLATYIAALGRGPGRGRALTQAEAADAMALLLAGAADPIQIGALLMLLRYRGEDPAEIAGMVAACRVAMCWPGLDVALDWPSYGAGRTRGAPWFLLAALALGQARINVFMHGTNEFSAGTGVAAALTALGLAPATNAAQAGAHLAACGFAYAPVADLSPAFAELLNLRRLLGLRSPLNTVARLLNPADAPAAVDGVFHPPYIETHLAVAERLRRQRLLVLKGGGGEAERNPAKPTQAYLWDLEAGRSVRELPALVDGAAQGEPELAALWRGTVAHAAIEARIIGTIALGLMATGRGGDAEAHTVWQNRRA